MRLIKCWLTTRNVIIANDVLVEIEIFANSVHKSDTLRDLAVDVLQYIADKVPFILLIINERLIYIQWQAVQNFPFTSIISPFDSTDSKPTDWQLAAGLATLERERYIHILAAEYIAHTCRLSAYSPNLQEALDYNKRIANWVMSSILRCEDPESRANRKTYFIKAAQVS